MPKKTSSKKKYPTPFDQDRFASMLIKLLCKKEHYDRRHQTLNHPIWEGWISRTAFQDFLNEPAHTQILEHVKREVSRALSSVTGVAAVVVHLCAENPESFGKGEFFSLNWLKDGEFRASLEADPNPLHWIIVEMLKDGAGTEQEMVQRMARIRARCAGDAGAVQVPLVASTDVGAGDEVSPEDEVPTSAWVSAPPGQTSTRKEAGRTESWNPARSPVRPRTLVKALNGPPTSANSAFSGEVEPAQFARALVHESAGRVLSTVYAVVRVAVTRGGEPVQSVRRPLCRSLLIGRGLSQLVSREDYDTLDLEREAPFLTWAADDPGAGIMIREDSMPRYVAVSAFSGAPGVPRRRARAHVCWSKNGKPSVYDLFGDGPEETFPPRRGDRIYLLPPDSLDNLMVEFLAVKPVDVTRQLTTTTL